MSRRIIAARAPSNIALVKYMGKQEPNATLGPNLPENASISMTLDRLSTVVEMEELNEQSGGLNWSGKMPRAMDRLLPADWRVPQLSDAGKKKFERHFERVVQTLARAAGAADLGAPAVEIRTANSFAEGAGIASSASAFAALTLTAAEWVRQKLEQSELPPRGELSRLARQGSGSACRSFDGPWVLWRGESAGPLESWLPEMGHAVLLVSAGAKAGSSSEAHARVRTSPFWAERPSRAEGRIVRAVSAIADGNLTALSQVAWEDFLDMHQLFHTAADPFTYWQMETERLLRQLRDDRRSGVLPLHWIVTMDAGPNIHVSFPLSEADLAHTYLEALAPSILRLDDQAGRGAEVLSVEGA